MVMGASLGFACVASGAPVIPVVPAVVSVVVSMSIPLRCRPPPASPVAVTRPRDDSRLGHARPPQQACGVEVLKERGVSTTNSPRATVNPRRVGGQLLSGLQIRAAPPLHLAMHSWLQEPQFAVKRSRNVSDEVHR